MIHYITYVYILEFQAYCTKNVGHMPLLGLIGMSKSESIWFIVITDICMPSSTLYTISHGVCLWGQYLNLIRYG